MREFRTNLSGKEHLLANLKAKKGMRELKSNGPLKNYSKRKSLGAAVKGDELFEWKLFKQKSKRHSNKLLEKRPDIVSKLNEMNRLEKEQKEAREEEERKRAKEDKGEWIFNSEYGEYYWVGEGQPYILEENLNEPTTKEELKSIREQEEKLYEEMRQQKIEEEKEKRKRKRKEMKEAMKKPIPPIPVSERCPYEKVREQIIKEREDAMIESGFFDDLLNYKNKIGLL